jgi:alpha-glucosidase (family GH31 glycosyl hydrolase)
VEKLQNGVELTAGSAKLRITVFRDGVIRVRLAPQGSFPKDFSWAVIESPDPPAIKVEDGKTELRMTAGQVVVVVKKSPLLITFANSAGTVLLEDEPSLPMAWDGGAIHVWKRMPSDESYFGLGDKPGPMNRRNHAYTMWNTDFFGWQRHGLRPVLRQHLSQQLRLRKRVARLFFVWSGQRRAELLLHCRPRTQENCPAVHRACRPHAASAALVAWLPAEPLQLLSRSARPRDRPNVTREKDPCGCHLF